MTQVWTAQFSYPGPYRMDITHATTDPIGRFFAPTKQMVQAYKYNTGQAEEVRRRLYEEQYAMLMLSRLPEMVEMEIWNKIMNMPHIVLICYCTAGAFCHRLLAKDMMIQQGCEYIGEFIDFDHFRKPKKPVIDNFHGEYSWLSNFSAHGFMYQEIWYPTNEHFFQGWKGTVEDRARIAALDTPGKAKRAGKKIKLAWNWDSIRDEVMMTGLMAKYDQNPQLRAKLVATEGFDLVEGNTWHDNYWGDCSCPKCAHITGQNKLGNMHMQIRENS